MAGQPCAARAGLEAGKEIDLVRRQIEVGILPGDHLAGIEQALGVGLALEGELDRVGLLHAAFLERVAVRIEDRAAIVLVEADDLVEPRLAGEAHDRQAGDSDVAVEADELEMAGHLVAEQLGHAPDALDDGSGRGRAPADR